MSGEIRKVPKTRREAIKVPKILGAKPNPETRAPKILDHNTKQKPLEIQTKHHGNRITIPEHTRRRPKKGKPDVRLQLMTREDREAWNAVKTNQWEKE